MDAPTPLPPTEGAHAPTSWRQRAVFWGLLLGGLLLWCCLQVGATQLPPYPYFDESFNAGAAQEYVEGRPVRELSHPPLYKMLQAQSLAGRLPPGERALSVDLATLAQAIRQPSVYTSALALAGLALVGWALLGPWWGLALAFTLACDPMFIVFGHIAMNYSFAMGFGLMGLAALLWALITGRRSLLWAAGLAFGLAIACRWTSAILCLPIGLGFLVAVTWPGTRPTHWQSFSWRRKGDWLHGLLALLLLPALVYLLAYGPTIATLPGGREALASPTRYLQAWWAIQDAAYQAHKVPGLEHASGSKWYAWPLQLNSTVFFFTRDAQREVVAAVIGVGTPWLWALSPLFLALALLRALADRQVAFWLAASPALLLWGTWAWNGDRLGFNHYFLELLPFALLSLALVLQSWWAHNPGAWRPRLIGLGLLGAANLAFACWMWPIATATPIGTDRYLARMWRPQWEAIAQIKALEARRPMSAHEQAEWAQRHRTSLRTHLMGRKDLKQKARSHDDRGTGQRLRAN